MCGIAGWIDWKRDVSQYRKVIEVMTDTLSHRGPDARGFWLLPNVALGHRRLVVVDPEGGSQPMTRKKGKRECTIVYNGELYNGEELRSDLEARGYIFQTRNSDTEVLLMAYIEWGPLSVERLNGIFAFAVWDETEQSLFLARDRLGVKPLFYYEYTDGLIFGSELKALLAHPEIEPRLDAEGLAEVLVMGPARTPGHGVYQGVKELKPGHYMVFNRKGVHIHRYWRLENRPHEDDAEITAARILDLLQDTVSRQLVADVPVCTLLSGGLDSSALTAFAVRVFEREGRGRLHTFSVAYEGSEQYFTPDLFQPDTDNHWVQKVSESLGTVHHSVTIDVNELHETLDSAQWANDLPGMADIDSSLYLFCREVRKEATVALSGECADEVFGGYPWFYGKGIQNTSVFPWMRMLDERMDMLSPEVVNHIRPREYVADRLHDALAEVPRLRQESTWEAKMREMTYLSITRFMPTLLDRKDRMSMAWGLEIRVPFSDHRLVEYVWNIPWGTKTYGGMPKGILRKALEGVLPDEVLARPKNPYPKTHHPKYAALVRKNLLRVLDSTDSPLLPLLNVGKVREAALRGDEVFKLPWFGQLMGDTQYFAFLLQVHWWLKRGRVRII